MHSLVDFSMCPDWASNPATLVPVTTLQGTKLPCQGYAMFPCYTPGNSSKGWKMGHKPCPPRAYNLEGKYKLNKAGAQIMICCLIRLMSKKNQFPAGATVCVSFPCSPHVHKDFLQIFWVLPTPQRCAHWENWQAHRIPV